LQNKRFGEKDKMTTKNLMKLEDLTRLVSEEVVSVNFMEDGDIPAYNGLAIFEVREKEYHFLGKVSGKGMMYYELLKTNATAGNFSVAENQLVQKKQCPFKTKMLIPTDDSWTKRWYSHLSRKWNRSTKCQ
jgi:hypothetical protein